MMPQKRKRRLQLVITLLLSLGVATGLVLYALKQNISLYLTPAELLASPPATQQGAIRLGGLVMRGSVKRMAGLKLQFSVTDFKQQLAVEYEGVLPTLFREGQGVVMDGYYHPERQLFVATRVLAKHDENYRPPGIQTIRPRAGR